MSKGKKPSGPSGEKLAAFRLNDVLHSAARQKAEQEDISFSQLMRRALRREVSAAAFTVKQ